MRRSSLRRRLLATSISLAVAGMAAVNVVAVLTLRDSLLGQVDRELLSIPQVKSRLPAGLGPAGAVPPQINSQFLTDTVIIKLDGVSGAAQGEVAGRVLDSAPRPDLSAVAAAIRAGTLGSSKLMTVGSTGDPSYTYRVRMLTATSGRSEVIVIARSLASVRETVIGVATVDALLTVLVVVILVGLGVPVIRAGLRPLTDVERAAERIGLGDLTVRAPHADEPTEAGSLSRTFNSMIDQIEEHFGARQASEDQLRRFLADASHELRTPLASIRVHAGLFRQGALSADSGSLEAVSRIESEAVRMSLLVDDLLLLARLDQHPMLEAEDVDLARLASEVAMATAIAAPEHLLEPVVAPGPADVVGDGRRLRQLVDNLFRNAVVHTPAGTTVRASVFSGDGEVRLVVADDGPGMSAQVAAHVFERFYRPDTGRARATAGTGLGLAIVESIAAAHGGSVALETAPGAGSRFTVTLPAAR